MIGRFGLLGVAALVLGVAGPAAAQQRTFEQILANCDRATGLPPGVTPPAQSGPAGKVVINPDWFQRIDAKDIGLVYPDRARSARASGKAVIRCQVGVDGWTHDCAVVSETPADLGFGAAALKLSRVIRLVPRRVNCEPVDGAVVTIPVAFNTPR